MTKICGSSVSRTYPVRMYFWFLRKYRIRFRTGHGGGALLLVMWVILGCFETFFRIRAYCISGRRKYEIKCYLSETVKEEKIGQHKPAISIIPVIGSGRISQNWEIQSKQEGFEPGRPKRLVPKTIFLNYVFVSFEFLGIHYYDNMSRGQHSN